MAKATTKPASRSDLGTVRKLPSGRYQASYRIDGERFTAPHTFVSHDAALGWLAGERADRLRGTWRDPKQGQVNLTDYLRDWLAARRLAERTATSYRTALDKWILPKLTGAGGSSIELGALDLAQLSPAVVRRWYAIMSENASAAALQRITYTPTGHPARAWARDQGLTVPDTGRVPPAILKAWMEAGQPLPAPRLRPSAEGVEPGRATAARAYQVLHAALTDATADGLILTNPCRIPGAATIRPRERGTVDPSEVTQLARAMPAHVRAAVYVAAWSGLRYGELFALARRHVSIENGTVRVERSLTSGRSVHGLTKTRGSVRTVTLPAFVVMELRAHLDTHTGQAPDALVFATADGRPIDSANLAHMFSRARRAIGRPELHWHDLRHTGATLAYRAGATVKDVQRRLGHATTRAAMIYAHTADDSDRIIAERLNAAFGDAAGNVVPLHTRPAPLGLAQ